MSIRFKRAYEKPAPSDGYRILVERLWPRGLSKQATRFDLWAKDVAPSTSLRKWFNHDPEKWEEFKVRYFAELDARSDVVARIKGLLRQGRVTFVLASKEARLNSAAALKEYLEQLGRQKSEGQGDRTRISSAERVKVAR
ncbi:MAG TPA: DUF488 family protein [Candidatus Methylomirabilis sp.]|nr:DUF488 family protein [Candidatus Methylomirabilis sp.]